MFVYGFLNRVPTRKQAPKTPGNILLAQVYVVAVLLQVMMKIMMMMIKTSRWWLSWYRYVDNGEDHYQDNDITFMLVMPLIMRMITTSH